MPSVVSVGVSSVLDALQRNFETMPEHDLTSSVIIPLFKAIGFHKVDYHGGPYEEGKDVICWRKDEIDVLELAVVQVKKFKASAASSSQNRFGELVDQLQQASEKNVPSIEGVEIKPSIVYFVTPYTIDTRALRTRFESYKSLRANRIKIIDGPNLARLVNEHLSYLVKDITGVEPTLRDALALTLNNKELFDALNAVDAKYFVDYYCDLDFNLGRVNARFFFSIPFRAERVTETVSDNDWKTLSSVCDMIEGQLECNIIVTDKTKISSTMQRRNKCEIEIDGHDLALYLESKQSWLAETILQYNTNEPTNEQLRNFLLQCHTLFESFEKILTFSILRKAVGISFEQKFRGDSSQTRVTFSIRNVLNTGIHIALFGEAGAGKTTTLQRYSMIHNQDSNDIISIYLPLSKIVKNQLASSNGDLGAILLGQVVSYIKELGVQITIQEFDQFVKSKRLVKFLFDGIDEVVGRFEHIVKAIVEIDRKYSNIQIVTASRMSGPYITEIPFIGVTLLPFNDDQLASFVKGWFEPQHGMETARVINHLDLHHELKNIVRNPLSATILCFLAVHGIPLPESESRLYDERFRLLLGHYDIYKHAVRVKSMFSTIDKIARKIGYMYHRRGIRYLDKGELIEWACDVLGDRVQLSDIRLGISELIEPCNILVPMTTAGQLGFGHLRFQEYLAARELMFNRQINILSLMQEDFWLGTLELYAAMADDLDFIIDYLANRRLQ